MKTPDDYFRDWEAHVFGFGYGSGEEHIVPALKAFMEWMPEPGGQGYNYRTLEEAHSPLVAWLFINALCRADIIEYGSSPRFGWLTPHGVALKRYLESKTEDELIGIACAPYDLHCYPDHCNCDGPACHNPFWIEPPNRGKN